MLGNIDAHANLAVSDMAAARKFYEDVLGLTREASMNGELIVYRSGNTTFNVYRSNAAGTNKATAVTWQVGDRIGDVVQAPGAKGVVFEHYAMPGTRLEGRPSRHGRHEGRVVQGPGRQHPQPRQHVSKPGTGTA